MEDELKQKKTEKTMTAILVILILLFVFIILIVVSNKGNSEPNEIPSESVSVSKYINIEKVDTSTYKDIYKELNINKVNFINFNDEIVNNFNLKQDEIINKLNSNKEYITNYNKENNIENYNPNSVANSTILSDINNNILSILYVLEENIDYLGENTYITNLLIDINKNTIVTNDELLTMYNSDKTSICSKLFDIIIGNHKEDNFIDKETKMSLTREEVINNKNKYVNILKENFDTSLYLYIYHENSKKNLYIKYSSSQLNSILFDEVVDKLKYSTFKV